jgi:hypothetical protein
VKDQYVADVNDFLKYALLRALVGDDLRLAVVWMLTPSDGRTDGGHVGYLQRPDLFRRLDPPLFDALRRIVDSDDRCVAAVEAASVLAGTMFFDEILADEKLARAGYFARAWELARGASMLFLDPDNGLEIASTPKGRSKSAKYLYWDEVAVGYGRGYSLVLYQHFPRRTREVFLRDLSLRAHQATACRYVLSLATSHVTFLVLPQDRHEKILTPRFRDFARHAGGLASAAEFAFEPT